MSASHPHAIEQSDSSDWLKGSEHGTPLQTQRICQTVITAYPPRRQACPFTYRSPFPVPSHVRIKSRGQKQSLSYVISFIILQTFFVRSLTSYMTNSVH